MKKKLNCVLLIDDDEPTNFLSRLLLEEADCAHHIQVEHGGHSALQYLTRSENSNGADQRFPCPDLIFLDINMPAMNGWEFLEAYASLENHHKGNVVMVMLTTSLNPDDRSRANGIPDVAGFETKPLTQEKLNHILQKYFAHGQEPVR
jgi:CheY-like chemotaxis protein